MGDDTRLDRRGFVRRVGAAVAGTLGVSHAGAARSAEAAAEQATDERITRFQMVLPVVEPLESTVVNVAVIPIRGIQPDERPPQECLPEGVDRLGGYEVAVVDLTESSLFGGDGNAVGKIERTRAYSSRALLFGTAYRIVSAAPCDGYLRVIVHELADEFELAIDDIVDVDGA